MNAGKTSKRKKSVLRVSRISEDLDKLLQRDAEDKRMSVNALVISILTKYAEWDRYSDRFGYVSVGRELFKAILETADREQLETIGDELGAQLPKQFILFWFKKINLETFLEYASLVSRYGGISKSEVEFEGRECTVSSLHELGPKWSAFMQHFLDGSLQSTLGIKAKFDTTKNSVVATFAT